jgi:hypothetical protein
MLFGYLLAGGLSALTSVLTDWVEWAYLGFFLAVPLAEFLILLAAFLTLDSGPNLAPKGEPEHLIEEKRRGSLLFRSQRIRESVARCARLHGSIPSLKRVRDEEDTLDRLLQVKRSYTATSYH